MKEEGGGKGAGDGRAGSVPKGKGEGGGKSCALNRRGRFGRESRGRSETAGYVWPGKCTSGAVAQQHSAAMGLSPDTGPLTHGAFLASLQSSWIHDHAPPLTESLRPSCFTVSYLPNLFSETCAFSHSLPPITLYPDLSPRYFLR